METSKYIQVAHPSFHAYAFMIFVSSDVGAFAEHLNAAPVCVSSVEEVAADLGPHLFR